MPAAAPIWNGFDKLCARALGAAVAIPATTSVERMNRFTVSPMLWMRPRRTLAGLPVTPFQGPRRITVELSRAPNRLSGRRSISDFCVEQCVDLLELSWGQIPARGSGV